MKLLLSTGIVLMLGACAAYAQSHSRPVQNAPRFTPAGIYFDDTLSCLRYGDTARKSGNLEQAVFYFARAIELGSRNPDVHAILVKCYLQLAQDQIAMETLEHALDLYPASSRLRTIHINYLFEHARWAEAVPSLDAAIAATPADARLYRLLGVAYERSGENERALAAYMRSVDIDPNYFDGLYSIGAYYCNRGAELSDASNRKLDAVTYKQEQRSIDSVLRMALPYLLRAREINPNDKKVFETLRMLYSHLGMDAEYRALGNY